MKHYDQPWYIFNSNINSFSRFLKEGYRALWTDGEQPELLLDVLSNTAAPLAMEDGLHGKLKDFISPGRKVVKVSGQDDKVHGANPTLCLLLSNDTHVYLMDGFRRLWERVVPLRHPLKNEGAWLAMTGLNWPSPVEARDLRPSDYGALLLGMDWDTFEICVMSKFGRQGLPTFCLQESVLNFGDQRRRMGWSDFPLIQGMKTTGHLHRPLYLLTGNPRYENLRPEPPPSDDLAVINCNFTYGVYEDAALAWVEAAVSACQRARMPYLILQHPRSLLDLSRFEVARSQAGTVHDYLRKGSLLISRFSSLIHEALGIGRPVIYFNPHGERLGYDFEAKEPYLSRVSDGPALAKLVSKSKEIRCDFHDRDFRIFLMKHCGAADGNASRRVAQAIKSVLTHHICPVDHPLGPARRLRAGLAYQKNRILTRLGRT